VLGYNHTPNEDVCDATAATYCALPGTGTLLRMTVRSVAMDASNASDELPERSKCDYGRQDAGDPSASVSCSSSVTPEREMRMRAHAQLLLSDASTNSSNGSAMTVTM
jgi:hypothetical protein